MAMRAFVTGSHAYGTPRPDSDIDLAVLAESPDVRVIAGRSGKSEINVVLFNNADEFAAWRKATESLKAKAPVVKEEAIWTIDRELDKIGVNRYAHDMCLNAVPTNRLNFVANARVSRRTIPSRFLATNSFVTGSYAYGIPRSNSDIDLAVFIGKEDMKILMNQSGRCVLNLITKDDPVEFRAWKKATAELRARRPVTRNEAIDVIISELERNGFYRFTDPNGVPRYTRNFDVIVEIARRNLSRN